jgi:hypothetical protein
MTHRVVAQLARTSGTTPCSRCLDIIDVQAGHWISTEISTEISAGISTEPDGPRAVCDRCALHDDPQGHMALLAWRRAAAGPTTGRRWVA